MEENIQQPSTNRQQQNIPDRTKFQSQDAYRNVRRLDPFDFVEFAYFGTQGFRDSSFLIPHPREVFYETRRDASYYINYFAPIVNAMVDQVYTRQLPRSTNNGYFEGFIKNADGLGGSLQDVVEDAMYMARLNDISYVVMDNFPKVTQPATAKSAIEQRVYPYIYVMRKQDVYRFEEDVNGRLLSIDFYDNKIRIAVDNKTIEVQTFRHWSPAVMQHYYYRDEQNKSGLVLISESVHNLGVLPVIPIVDFARRKRISQILFPSNYNLAYLCYALFNKESEIVSLEMYQCFSIFYVSGRLNIDTLGHSNVIEVPLDAKFPPGYASPSPAMMDSLVKNTERLVESIYRNAKQKGVVALVEQSGIAKQWDFRGEEGLLKRTALAGEKLEQKIAELFGRYIKSAFEYKVNYPEQFSPMYHKDLVTENLDILKEQPPKPLEKRLWVQLAEEKFGTDEETKDTLIKELEAEGENNEPENGTPAPAPGAADGDGEPGQGEPAAGDGEPVPGGRPPVGDAGSVPGNDD